MTTTMKWGILGTGNIARQFSAGMCEAQSSTTVAVASRNAERARDFATQFQIPKCYGDYERLLADEQVEAVYISLPNHLHHEWSIKALKAGKHVLCEKPLAMNTLEAEEMFEVAKASERVLMEAFMYQCHPLTLKLLETIRSGVIGQVKLVKTSFSFFLKSLDQNIRNVPEFGGGALMDVGCYCISMARITTGEEPVEVLGTGIMTETGVDIQSTGCLKFPSGAVASFACGMAAQTDNSAYICGDQGYITVPVPWKPQAQSSYFEIHTMTMPKQDQLKLGAKASPSCEKIEAPVDRHLYAYEIDAFAEAIQSQHALRVSPDNSLGNMKVLDALRAQIGLSY